MLLLQRGFIAADVAVPDIQSSIDHPNLLCDLLEESEVVRNDYNTTIEVFDRLRLARIHINVMQGTQGIYMVAFTIQLINKSMKI